MNKIELLQKRADLVDRLEAILGGDDDRDLTPSENARFIAVKAEIDALDKAIREHDMQSVNKAAAAVPHYSNPDDMPAGMMTERFSLSRLIRGVCDNRRTPEHDLSDRIQNAIGDGQGFALPMTMSKAALSGVLANAGALVPDVQMGLIEALLAPSLVEALPLTRITVPRGQGALIMPRVGSTSTASWTAEAAPATESDMSLGQLQLVPRLATVYCRFSRMLLQTSSPAIDGILEADMAKALSTCLDTALLSGTGVGNAPLGILGQAATTVSESASANLWDALSDCIANLDTANVPQQNRVWLFNPAGAARLRTEFIQNSSDSTDGSPILQPGGAGLMGYPVITHSAVPAQTACLAHWPDVVIAGWGPLTVIVDPYSEAPSGMIRIVGGLMADVALRHSASLVKLSLAS